jgi:hypothetical protein
MSTRTRSIAVLMMAAIVVAACSTTAPSQSGFLGDYSALKPDKHGKAGLLWAEKSGFNWSKYKKVMLDPVVIYYHPQAGSRAIQPEELNKLAGYFREVVAKELEGSYPVTTAAGPDVLRIRTAITDVVPANPALNAVTTAVAFVPLDLGGAAIEAELLDSTSNERLAAMVERKKGSPMNLKGGFTELGHAKAAFQEWAVDLKRALQTNP